MALTRAYEEHEVTPELRRTYCSIRTASDLPFVPTLFKLSAGIPEYLLKMWDDLGPVVCSKEFQTAAQAFQEILIPRRSPAAGPSLTNPKCWRPRSSQMRI